MNNILKLLHSTRSIGLGNGLRAIRYGIRRDLMDRLYSPHDDPSIEQAPGKLGKIQTNEEGAIINFENYGLSIQFLEDDLIFLGWEKAERFPSYGAIESEWSKVSVSLTDVGGEEWQLESSKIKVRIGRRATLEFFDEYQELLRCEESPKKIGNGWISKAGLISGASIHGLGERASRLNLRPGTYRFWNREAKGSYKRGDDPLYTCMPVYLCLGKKNNYLIFYDNTYDGHLTLGETAEINFLGGPFRYYIGVGRLERLLELFSTLTGKPNLPPLWALGYQQSQWGYQSEKEMRRIYAGFKQHDLPISALVMDIDHQDGYQTFSINEEQHPRLRNFSEQLKDDGVHLVSIIDPGIKKDENYDLFREGRDLDLFCKTPKGRIMEGVVWPGWTAYPDFTNPRARAWWGEQYQRLLKFGIRGFWHDMNEPSSFALWGENTLPLCTQHDWESKGADHRQAHNVYGLLMNRAGYEGLRELRPHERPFILSRSGWVGMQRYAWNWTGDISTSWEMLQQTIPTVLGLSLSGIPYSGPDIGGFTDSPSEELYIRWFQLGAFLPFFRTHSAFYLPRREPWEMGEKALEITREMLQLRYRLLPYWYTLAWQANQSGLPLLRPLFWDDLQNETLRNIDDSFLIGEALLVAPIIMEGTRQRNVYLPKGEWYTFEKDQFFEGSEVISLEGPIEEIPLLVRAGSILPTSKGKGLELHVYKPAKERRGEGVLYSDAGDGYGPYRLDRFILEAAETGDYKMSWISEGDFEWLYDTITLCLHGFEVDHIWVDGKIIRIENSSCKIPVFQHIII